MANDTIAPVLLVAMPQLEDSNFARAVVLLVEHSAEGALGLVLNRPGDLSVAELCESLEIEWAGDGAVLTCWGGPVQPNMGWMLFSEPPDLPEETEEELQEMNGSHDEDEEDDDEDDVRKVLDGVYFGMTLETLRALTQDPPDRFRLFLGYSGWGPGQLETEMARGDWIIAPADADCILGTSQEDLWTRVIHSLGVDPSHLVSTPGIH